MPKMPKFVHEIRFPRWHEDVSLQKRTVAHIRIRPEERFFVGDELRLLAAPNFPRCGTGTLTEVALVKLLDVVDSDLAGLNVTSREEYLARWDALHPDMPSSGNPEVWRIAWRYRHDEGKDPPEWSLAS